MRVICRVEGGMALTRIGLRGRRVQFQLHFAGWTFVARPFANDAVPLRRGFHRRQRKRRLHV